MRLAVASSRFLLALTFLFSGFVKAVDPQGMAYKLNAYLYQWGVTLSDDAMVLHLMAIVLGVMEFMLGVSLLLGMRRRLTATLMFVVMAVMTLLTLYVYIENPVPDCGCFGDAVKLTNGETLLKNVVLLAAAVVLLRYSRMMKRLISERNQWVTSIFSFVYIVVLGLLSNHYLPPLDFTPYKIGTDLRAVLAGEGITEENQDLLNFYLMDAEGNDLTVEIPADTGYTFLLTLPDAASADDGCNDRINDLYDACSDHGMNFYAIVGEGVEDVPGWIDRTGAAYSFLTSDARQLRAAVRSNPGLLLLHDGKIVEKWSNNNLPESAEFPYLCSVEEKSPLLRLFLWFVIPLLLVVLADSVWIGSKYYKRHILKKSLKTNDNEKENCSR